jgi:hypothetical protein
MLDSIETYRGHTKGFEFSFIEVLGIAVIVASAKRRDPGWRLLGPGTFVYLGWCALMALSLFHSISLVHGLMAVVKFTKIVILLVAGFHFLRDEEDLFWVLRTLAAMLIFMALTCLKMRLIEGRFRTVGTFEHQNPMAMWCYFGAIPLFAMALRKETVKRDSLLFLGAVAGAGICVLLSVSRGALAAFGVGCVAVMGLAFLRGVSKKLITITVLSAIGGVLVALTALDSVFARMKEEKGREADGEEDLRAVMIAQARAMLHDSSIGIGWNNYGIANSRPLERYSLIMEEWDLSRGFRIYEENYYMNPLTESYYWLILGENGYPGIYGCAAFLATTLIWGLRVQRAFWKTAAGWFAGALLVALSLQYIHATVERVLTQTKNLSLWLLMLGLLSKLEYLRRRKQLLPAKA